MPIYIFENPKTKETVEIIQKMNDKHEYKDKDGLEWKRVFVNPCATFDTQIDPFSKSDFIKKTKNIKATIGDMWELSENLSKKREKSRGLDPVKNETVTKYEAKTGGAHPLKHS